jgi:hypothetical protein
MADETVLMEKIKSLSSYRFKYKEPTFEAQGIGFKYDTNLEREGLLAHELQEEGFQYAVKGEKDAVKEDGSPNYQVVDYDRLVPALWTALSGSLKRIDILESSDNNTLSLFGRSKYKIIDLPEYWIELVDFGSITVQLTPISKHQKLFVEKIRDNSIYINSEKRGERLDYFYNIYGEKK